MVVRRVPAVFMFKITDTLRLDDVLPACLMLLKDRAPNTYESLQEAECAKWTPWKLAELVWLIEARKPKRILELGSGLTTILFNELAPGRVVSIDENAEYARTIKCPTADIRLRKVEDNGEERSYRDLPQDDWDFVYVDGPAMFGKSRNDGSETKVCTDSVHLAKRGTTFVYDIRTRAIQHLMNHEEIGPRVVIEALGFPGSGRITDLPWQCFGLRYHTVLRIAD